MAGRALDHDPSDRAAFLDEACAGDVELRSNVESLLGHDAGLHSLLATRGPGAVLNFSAEAPADLQPGEKFGRYEIVRKLGEGGMGVVFLARESEPIRRDVALKFVKLGMDTRLLIARFEAERQTLALLDHWNIARLHHAGATPKGRPYFVMEYIDGPPITVHADGQRLSLHERLELFIPVCRAIHHAHQKGVVHRDIKPSNVLVADSDSTAVPKIIDFGIAKIIQPSFERGTLTEVGHILGTPEYMSPEQADPTNNDIDASTDIYSLGVLLYELLTGRVPFEMDPNPASAATDLLRRVQDETPKLPSACTRVQSEAAETFAQRRRRTASSLRRDLRGELDWIVMRALEKERNRRYSSADDLAADLTRYLENEPVQARPPSTIYQVRKVISRHRLAFTFMLMVFVFSIGVSVVMTGLWQGQRRERLRAEQVNSYVTRVLGSTTSRIVLDEAASIVESEIREDDQARAELQALLAGAYRNLDLFEESRNLFEAALAGQDDLAEEAMMQRAEWNVELGATLAALQDYEAAEVCFENALVTFEEQLGEAHSTSTEARLGLANIVIARGDINRARHLFTSLSSPGTPLATDDLTAVAVSMIGLADICRARREVSAADSLYRDGVTLLSKSSSKQDSRVAQAMTRWAEMHANHGNLHLAVELQDEAVDLYHQRNPHSGSYALELGRLASFRSLQGENEIAESEFRQALDITEVTHGEGHLNTGFLQIGLGEILIRTDRAAEAEPMIREFVDARRSSKAPEIPFDPWARSLLGWCLVAQGRYSESEELLLESYRVFSTKYELGDGTRRVLLDRIIAMYESSGRAKLAEPYRLQLPS